MNRLAGLITASVFVSAVLAAVPLSQPASATYPGTNGVIVFTGPGGQLNTINPSGTGETPITAGFNFAEAPQASADGNWIVFDADNGTNLDLYKIHPNGTGQVQLTNDAVYEWAPSFSPDGKKIIFSHGGSDGQIWVINADGSNEHRLSKKTGEFAKYSPNGKKIVYGNRSDGQIHIMNADATHDHALTNFGNNDYPDWLPNGNKIGWTSDAGGVNDVWIMKPDGTHDHEVTLTGAQFSPVYAPNSRLMLFSDGTNLYTSNIDGSSPVFLAVTTQCCEGWVPN